MAAIGECVFGCSIILMSLIGITIGGTIISMKDCWYTCKYPRFLGSSGRPLEKRPPPLALAGASGCSASRKSKRGGGKSAELFGFRA